MKSLSQNCHFLQYSLQSYLTAIKCLLSYSCSCHYVSDQSVKGPSQKWWSDDETKSLIAIVAELNVVDILDKKKSRSAELYNAVQREMNKKGFQRT